MNAVITSSPSSATSPKDQASRLVGIVRQIQEAAKESDFKISEIESRGWIKNLVASNRDDLISTAKSQSRINDLFVRLNQEVIALNTLGYVYLANVIAEFERQVNEGVRDSDGRIHILSENGKRVANAAKEMFSAILDSSRSTQEKIDANAEAAEALRIDVDTLAESTLIHTGFIKTLQDVSAEIQTRTDRIGAIAVQHGANLQDLSDGLAQATQHAAEVAESHRRSLQHLEQRVESVTAVATSIVARTGAVEQAASAVDVRIKGQTVLAAEHSKSIGEATERIGTLMQKQSETNARLKALADLSSTLEANSTTFLSQIAQLSADHAAEKSRLRHTTWVLGTMISLLASTCIILALRIWHPF